MDSVNIKFLLRTIYLTLHQYGYSEVSLKKKDLLDYVPKIEKEFMKYGIEDNDLFVKTPVEEMYDEYKNFLIEDLYGRKLGYFNEKYDTIILNCSNSYICKCQESLNTYKKVMHRCCYFICKDTQFIGDGNAFEKSTLISDAEKKQYKKSCPSSSFRSLYKK